MMRKGHFRTPQEHAQLDSSLCAFSVVLLLLLEVFSLVETVCNLDLSVVSLTPPPASLWLPA